MKTVLTATPLISSSSTGTLPLVLFFSLLLSACGGGTPEAPEDSVIPPEIGAANTTPAGSNTTDGSTDTASINNSTNNGVTNNGTNTQLTNGTTGGSISPITDGTTDGTVSQTTNGTSNGTNLPSIDNATGGTVAQTTDGVTGASNNAITDATTGSTVAQTTDGVTGGSNNAITDATTGNTVAQTTGGVTGGSNNAITDATTGSTVAQTTDGATTNSNKETSIDPADNTPVITPTPNTAPRVSGDPQTEIIAGENYTFTPQASDADGDTLSFSVEGKPAWASFDAKTGTLSGSPRSTDVGNSSLVVISVSDGKAVSKLDAFTLRTTKLDTAPSISGEPITQTNSGKPYRFAPIVSDQEGDALDFTITGLPTWGQFDVSTGELTGYPEKTDVGDYDNIIITVTDGKFSSSLGPFSITVLLTNSAPVISGTPANTVAGNSEYLFTPVVSDADNDPLVFTIDQTPAWAVFDTATGALSGTPGNDQTGLFANIVIAVSDGRETTQLPPFAINVSYTNTAPVISGTPTTWIQPGSAYSFSPSAVDNDPNTNLSYSAQNLPDWARLDATTGTITGTPTAESLHQNIVLSVSDGQASDQLPFFIRVQALQDFARTQGAASQGSQWGSMVASNAIDGTSDTSSHTGCVADRNWWQVTLPTDIDIHRIEITSTNNNLNRIAGASVFVSNKDYKDLPASASARETLVATGAPQVFTYDPPLKGSHVAVKATGSNCLHMSDVQVFGRAQDAPLLDANLNLYVPVPATIGDWVGKIDAQDLQGDSVSYALSGDNVPFSIDASGNITVSGTIEHNKAQAYEFTVSASDSVNQSMSNVRVGMLGRSGVKVERWTDIGGKQIVDLTGNEKYLLPADEHGVVSTLDVTGGRLNNYGLRMTSYLRPLVSGTYYFSIAGDDSTALEISSTVNPEQATRVVERTNYSSYQNWSQSVQSRPIRLQAGSTYFIRALLKDGSGGDHASVGWRMAGDDTFTLIPENQLFRALISSESVKPTLAKHETTYLLGQASKPGDEVTTIKASDTQGDALAYSIDANVPFAVDQTGKVSVNGSLTPSTTYTFTVSVSDGTNVTNTELSVSTTVVNEVEHALATGDAYVVSRASLLEDEILATITKNKTMHNDVLLQLLNLDADGTEKADGSSLTAISWEPTHDAALLGSTFGENKTILTTNVATANGYEAKKKTLAVLGETDARYIAMGGNPMRNYRRNNANVNEQMHQFMENSLGWLTNRSDLKTKPFNVVIANMYDSSYFPDEQATREWLDRRFPGMAKYNPRKTCDDDALAACITSTTDLLIISQHSDVTGKEQVVVDTVKSAMKQGIPVLYMHYNGHMYPLGNLLFPVFNITHQHDNNWHRLALSALDQRDYMNDVSDDISAVETMMRNFKQQSFVVDWTDCDENNPEKCSDNVSLNKEFWTGAWYLRGILRGFDEAKINLFDHPQKYRLNKLLVLLGDHYRRDVVFPMNARTAAGVSFFRAFFADHVQVQYRDKVGAWTNLGNFSRTDFSHITPTTRTVKHTSKRNFRSTGAYALPGQKVTVKRNDNSAVNVKVFVNSLRAGSTRTFATNGYKRPRYLQAASMPIASGETISFVSAIGGPIHLSYDTNDLPVEVTFSNIGEHAYWRDTTDTDSFSAKLAAEEFDWAEVAAPSFEVHSKTDKMQQSVNNPVLLEGVGSTQALVDTTMKYVHNAAHTLAGFKGPGIDVIPEIHQFATDNGLEIFNLDVVKHMNADQSTCGYGCSGNPYDAYWSFNPVGHGDLHEMGHGLEKARFRLSGWPTHASTNFYSFYAKHKYFDNTGADPTCGTIPFKPVYDWLQGSINSAHPKAYLKLNLWKPPINYAYGTTQIVQMMMGAQDIGALQDGWHLLARLHIIERAYQSAVNNDEKWLAIRDGLGMGMYARAAAKGMSTEDWLLIAASHAIGRDFRAYFDVWGHTYSDEASAQVAAMSLPAMPLNYYVSSSSGFCKGEGFDGVKLPLDGGTHAWTR